MAEILRETPDRTAKDVVKDLERILAGVGDDAPIVQLLMSLTDLQLIRGLAGKPDVNLHREYPSVVKALKMQVQVRQEYNGPPRIVRTIGNLSFDAHAEQQKRDQVFQQYKWRESNVRLRQGIDGRPLL